MLGVKFGYDFRMPKDTPGILVRGGICLPVTAVYNQLSVFTVMNLPVLLLDGVAANLYFREYVPMGVMSRGGMFACYNGSGGRSTQSSQSSHM